MSTSAIAFLVFGYRGLAFFTFLFVLTEIAWPILNRYRCYDLSRVGMLVSSNLLGLMVSLALPGTGYNRGFYVMAGLPVLLFGLREKRYIALGLLLPVVLYPFSEWAQPFFPYALDLSADATRLIHAAIGVIYVVLIFLMFLFLSMENDRAERSLDEQRAKSFSSAKFAALGEMASGIAHEINNPITVISLGADRIRTLIQQPEVDRTRIGELAVSLKGMSRRVSRIVEAMRSFSRDGVRDPFERVSLGQIVADTLPFCTERFKNHGIRLDVRLPESELEIECRAVQISQVLLNLLNNAYDALEGAAEKEILLEVSRNEAGGTVTIRLCDTGCGVRPEERERIFQPFYTTKPVGRGTGLGLSLSRSFARDHGGELVLDSGHPKTCFVLELPVRQARGA
jgi:signal transduction histidine kinase